MQFTLDDFAAGIRKLRTLSTFPSLLSGAVRDSANQDLERDARRLLAIIGLMTKDEREYPEQIHPDRSRRIARGSGTDPKEVDDVVRQFLGLRQFFNNLQKGLTGRADNPRAWSTVPFERRIWPLK